MQGPISTSWYAIKLNDKYWLGHHAMDNAGASGILGPSISGAFLIPTDSSEKTISSFRNLAKEHGGQIVRLNLDIPVSIDEMLRSKFEKLENIESEDPEEEDPEEEGKKDE